MAMIHPPRRGEPLHGPAERRSTGRASSADRPGRSRSGRRAAVTGALLSAVAVAGGSLVGVSVGSPSVLAQSSAISADEAEVFVSLDPQRVLDTRNGVGRGGQVGRLGPRQTITLDVGGVGAVPANATSVAINTTFPKASTEPTFVTIWPTGQARPTTSANNSTPGQETPNFGLAKLGTGGAIQIYNDKGQAHFVVDVVGYFVPASAVSDLGGTGGTGGDGRTFVEAGPPSVSIGVDGDTYLDEINLVFYGPKAGGSWGTGVDLTAGGTSGGAGDPAAMGRSAVGLGLAIDLLGSGSALTFPTPDAAVGDAISYSGGVFTFVEAGVYEVTVVATGVSLGVLGGVDVDLGLRLDGTPLRDVQLLDVGVPVMINVLVDVEAGDTLDVFRSGLLSVAVTVDASITIDRISAG